MKQKEPIVHLDISSLSADAIPYGLFKLEDILQKAGYRVDWHRGKEPIDSPEYFNVYIREA